MNLNCDEIFIVKEDLFQEFFEIKAKNELLARRKVNY